MIFAIRFLSKTQTLSIALLCPKRLSDELLISTSLKKDWTKLRSLCCEFLALIEVSQASVKITGPAGYFGFQEVIEQSLSAMRWSEGGDECF